MYVGLPWCMLPTITSLGAKRVKNLLAMQETQV